MSLITIPLTHEEGHRAVLTTNHIGSVSNPFFNENLAAYVKGVSDQTLIPVSYTHLGKDTGRNDTAIRDGHDHIERFGDIDFPKPLDDLLEVLVVHPATLWLTP